MLGLAFVFSATCMCWLCSSSCVLIAVFSLLRGLVLQLEQLMEQQRQLRTRRPRPGVGVDVLRQTDVTKELDASRDTQQISKAVDSILAHDETQGRYPVASLYK